MKELRRILSKLGFASRTQAEDLIRRGAVKVNGAVIRDPLRSFDPTKAKIEVDEQRVQPAKARVLLFHKPKGVVTTRSDEKGRKTVFDVIGSAAQGLHAVGRLDMNTTGLLLLTNQNEFSARLTDPKEEIEREYIVTVRGFCELRVNSPGKRFKGESEVYTLKQCTPFKTSQRESHLRVVVTEGKNREIRNVFKTLDHEVKSLKRIRFGPYQLGELSPGEFIEIELIHPQECTKTVK